MVIQAAIGFSIGLLSLHYWPYVLADQDVLIITLLGGGVALFLRYYLCHYALANVLIWLLAGGSFVYISTNNYINTVIQIPPMGANITIVGIVDSIQNVNIPSDNFDFIIKKWKVPSETSIREMKVRIYWNEANTLKQGELLTLQVVLRRPYGRVNQAGYDAEKWYVGHGFHGRGNLVEILPVTAPPTTSGFLHQQGSISVRQLLFDTVVDQVIALPRHGLLLALSFGVKDALTADDWLWLRDSGLAHLMAISGLHIGLAVGLGWWVGLRLRGILPEVTYFTWLPMWIGLLLALCYAWLAGFSVPTQRALLMASLVMLFIRYLVVSPAWFILLLTFALCLAIDPLASYTMGFWFSFFAVFVLLVLRSSQQSVPQKNSANQQQEDDSNVASGVGIDPLPSANRRISLFASMVITTFSLMYQRSKQLLFLQLYLLILMLPLQWSFFGGFSALAPAINFIVLPLVSLLTVPLIFAALLVIKIPSLAAIFWQLADWSLWPVAWLGQLSVGAWLEFSLLWLPVVVLIALFVVGLRLLPFHHFPALYFSIVLGFCCWQWQQYAPIIQKFLFTRMETIIENRAEQSLGASTDRQWHVDMLDVGHGLSVLITRNGRAVLYDTGNRWRQGSIAASVVEPVLKYKGIYTLDGLILSHADSDHAGGASYLSARYAPSWKRSSDYRLGYLPCIKGETWEWQSLTFTVIWPPKRVKRAANPHSCVITISDKLLASREGHQETEVLLTGDIDAISELLIAREQPKLSPDVFFVPHHGSRTSSSVTWLNRMTPKLALVSVSRYNPWQLPAISVKERYQVRGIPWLSTAESGQVSVVIQDGDIQYKEARTSYQQTWYRDVFSAL